MAKRGRPRKKHPSLDEQPDVLRLSIVKIMAQHNISDVEEAYSVAALLLDSNSNLFDKKISEAERRFRSRLMRTVNKARSTITKNVKDSAYNSGFLEGRSRHRIWGYCVRCGRQFYIEPNTDSHKALIDLLRERGWAHIDCK